MSQLPLDVQLAPMRFIMSQRLMLVYATQADVAGGDKAAEYVLAPQGLFPAPLIAGTCRLPSLCTG